MVKKVVVAVQVVRCVVMRCVVWVDWHGLSPLCVTAQRRQQGESKGEGEWEGEDEWEDECLSKCQCGRHVL